LGFAANVSIVNKTCVNNGVSGEYYVLNISGNTDRIPCKLKRKQASARRQIKDWLHTGFKIVQVGEEDEPKLDEVDLDLRGKTNYQQLARVIKNSMLHLSPDTFTMHLAVAMNVPTVALFGCSIATSTGPWVKDKSKAKYILLQSERKSGCVSKPCYKNRCAKSQQGNGPIAEIDPAEIFNSCVTLLKEYE
jgi:ADP-heptose:LPS heptosyltransferase